jgi:hypothetical protein
VPDRHRDDGFDPDRWDAQFIIARDGPRELEPGVHRRTLASLNNGWLARGGHLRLHDDRLSFAPSPLERVLLAREVQVDFGEITAIERRPPRAEDVLPGGQSPRLRVHAGARRYDFVFHDGLDDWIQAIEERRQIWARRRSFDAEP